jgi:hypothetical protein
LRGGKITNGENRSQEICIDQVGRWREKVLQMDSAVKSIVEKGIE